MPYGMASARDLTRICQSRILGVVTTDENYEAILGEVRAETARRRWTDSDLARRAGITQATISRRMSGLRPLTVPELLAICAALDVPLADLAEEARKHAVPAQRAAGEQSTRPWVAGPMTNFQTSSRPFRWGAHHRGDRREAITNTRGRHVAGRHSGIGRPQTTQQRDRRGGPGHCRRRTVRVG